MRIFLLVVCAIVLVVVGGFCPSKGRPGPLHAPSHRGVLLTQRTLPTGGQLRSVQQAHEHPDTAPPSTVPRPLGRVRGAISRATYKFRRYRDTRIVLFPTFAYREHSNPDKWVIRTKGWIFTPRKPGEKPSGAMSTLARFFRLKAGTEMHQFFTKRTNFFMVKNLKGKAVSVQCCGEESHDSCCVAVLPTSRSDKHGHFDSWDKFDACELPAAVSTLQENSAPIVLPLRTVPQPMAPNSYEGEIYFIPEVGWSVISDIDDTIKHTEVCFKNNMLRNTFLKEFELVGGMGELYRRWEEQGAAFHYVSSSPWQLQPEIQSTLCKFGVPGGSYHLKDFDIRSRKIFNLLTPSSRSKPKKIQDIMHCFPKRQFILVGDSGEQDPEIYASILRHNPSQVYHVYIRRVDGDGRTEESLNMVFSGIPQARWTIFSDANLLFSKGHGDLA